jgi:hypothetical protein
MLFSPNTDKRQLPCAICPEEQQGGVWIEQRTKAALAEAKRRGTILSNPRESKIDSGGTLEGG